MASNTTFQVFRVPRVAGLFAGTHRFGHTSDFSMLFGTPAEQQDYIVGLLVAAIFYLAICFVWLVLLIVFRCLGPKKVGFLSGANFRRVVKNEGTEVIAERISLSQELTSCKSTTLRNGASTSRTKRRSVLKNYHELNSLANQTTRIRLAFLLCGSISIIFAFLAVTKGLTQLQSSVDTVNQSAKVVDELATEGDLILAAILDVKNAAIELRNELVKELTSGNFCPADPSIAPGNNTQYVQQAVQQAKNSVPQLQQLQDFVAASVQDLQSSLRSIQSTAKDLENATDGVNFTSWQGLLVLIPFTVIPAALMAGTILAMFDVHLPYFNCILNWFAMPIFFLVVIFACVCAALMLMGASANADFCLPGGRDQDATVDTSILEITVEQGYSNTSMHYRVVQFYVEKCFVDDPFQFAREFILPLQECQLALTNLTTALQDSSTVTALELYCNREYNALQLLLVSMLDFINVILQGIQQTLELLSCESIVPIYTSVAYDAACSDSMSAVMWVFAGFCITGFCGMLMLTFRSAYKRTIYVTPQDYELENAVPAGPPNCDSLVQEIDADEDFSRHTLIDYGRSDSKSSAHDPLAPTPTNGERNTPFASTRLVI